MDTPTLRQLLQDAGGRCVDEDDYHFGADEDEVVVSLHVHKRRLHGLRVLASLKHAPAGADKERGAYRSGGAVMATAPPLSLRRESTTDIRAKELGLSRELQTGDPHFDGQVYIVSDADDEDVHTLLAHDTARRRAIELLELGAGELGVNAISGQLHIEVDPHHFPETPGALRRLLDMLLELRDALPAFASFDRGADRGPGDRLGVAMAVTALLGPVLMVPALTNYQLADHDLAWQAAALGALLCIGLSLMTWRRTRGTSAGLSRLLWVVIGGGIGLPSLAVAAALSANGALDATRQELTVKVVSRSKSSSRGRSYYNATVALGAPHDRSLLLPVRPEVYHQLRAGGSARLEVGPGALGHRWIVGVLPAARR